jgi:hypothetical protein
MNNPLQTFEPTKLPWLLPIKRAVAVSGLSRSTIYRMIKEQKLDARKMQSSTLVLTESLLPGGRGSAALRRLNNFPSGRV